MSDKKENTPESVENAGWGRNPENNFGYSSDEERKEKRGLEDWEMVQTMNESKVSIPYWFIAIFILLLIVAIGLTFPFWGNRPGYERPWFDWGIPAGVAWVVFMSFLIYYFVDLRHILKDKREAKKKEEAEKNEK